MKTTDFKRRLKTQKIKTKLTNAKDGVQLGGWLQGTYTYLWFGTDEKCLGILDGEKLYRLARAITRRWEES